MSKLDSFLKANGLKLAMPRSSAPAQPERSEAEKEPESKFDQFLKRNGLKANRSYQKEEPSIYAENAGKLLAEKQLPSLDKATYDRFDTDFVKPMQQLYTTLSGFGQNGTITQADYDAYRNSAEQMQRLLDGRKAEYQGNEQALKALDMVSKDMSNLNSYANQLWYAKNLPTHQRFNAEFYQPMQELYEDLKRHGESGGITSAEDGKAYAQKREQLQKLLDGRRMEYQGDEVAQRELDRISAVLTDLGNYQNNQRLHGQATNILMEGVRAGNLLREDPNREDADELKKTYYSSLFYRPDFEENSKFNHIESIPYATYEQSENPEEYDKLVPWDFSNPNSTVYPDADKLIYEVVNGSWPAGVKLADLNYKDDPIWDELGGEYRYDKFWGMMTYLEEDERNIFNYVCATGGIKEGIKFLNFIGDSVTARTVEGYNAKTAAQAKKHPIISSVNSVVEAPFKGLINLVPSALDSFDGKVDPLSNHALDSYKKTATRNAVAEEIDSDFGKWAYQTTMGIADSATRTAVSFGNPFVSNAMLAGDTLTANMLEAEARGLEGWQATALAYIGVAAEIVTEQIQFDKLFMNEDLTKATVKKYILENMGTEALEEMSAEGVNYLADALISKDKSQWQMAVNAYKAEGKSDAEAWLLAIKDQGAVMLQSGGTGAISGGVMAGGTAGFTYLSGSMPDAPATMPKVQSAVQTEYHKRIEAAKEGLESLSAAEQMAIYNEVVEDLAAGKLEGYEMSAEEMAAVHNSYQQYLNAHKDAVNAIPTVPPTDAKTDTPATSSTTADTKNADDAVLKDTDAAGETGAVDTDAVADGDSAVTENLIDNEVSDTIKDEPVSLADKIRQEQNDGGITYENNQPQYDAAGIRADIQQVFQRGTDLPNGSPERLAGTGTGEQAGRLGGSPAQSQKRSGVGSYQTPIGRQNRGKHLPQISSNELGLDTGTDTKNLRLMPQELWDDDMTAVADRIYNETGKQVQFVLGKIQVKGASGAIRNVRGVFTGDGIIVQADNSRYSISQIADHEAYHVKASPEMAGQGLNQAIRQHIIETFSEEELNRVVNAYLEALDGVYNISDAKSGAEFEEAVWAVEEEVFADAYAGINAFGAHADKFTEAVNAKMDSEYLGKQIAQESGTKETTGPPRERYSVDESDDSDYNSSQKDLGLRGEPKNMPQSPREWGAFNRSFANKTAGMKPGEHREIRIFTADYAYFVEADGYMQGYADLRIEITDANRATISEWEARINGDDQYRGDVNRWAETVRPNQRGNSSDPTISEYGREAESANRLSRESQERDNARGIAEVTGDSDEINFEEIGPGALVFDGENGWEIDKDGSASLIRYSVDDSDYDAEADAKVQTETDMKIQAELDSEKKRWEDAWLRDRLGDAEADAYLQRQKDAAKAADEQKRAEERQKAEQRKAEAKKKAEEKAARNKQAREERQQKWEADKAKRAAKEEAESRPTIAKKELRRTLLDFFSIPIGSRSEIATIIDQFADRLVKNGEVTESDRKAFFERMYQAGVMTIPAGELYQLGRGHIASGRIYVNDSVRAEFGDDWNTIRKRAFAAGVYLTNDPSHSGIDSWNTELAELFPGLFDSEETDLRMALERIVQIAEDGKDERVSLPEYTARMAGIEHVSEDAYLDHMERKVDEALRTFAKSAELEIHLKKKAIKDRADLSRSSFLARQKLAQEREQRKEMSRQQQEQKELRELQQRTLKNLQWLSKNRNRMPEELKPVADELLGDLDILAVGAANEMRWSDRYNATWRDAVDMYKHATENDPNFMPSDDLERMMMRLDGDKIADLDVGALQTLYKAVVGLRTEYHNRNNVINDEMNRLFAEVYTDVKQEIESAPGGSKGDSNGYNENVVDKFFNKWQLTPMNVLHRMGGWNPNGTFYSMAKQLEKGERDVRAYTVKANRMLEGFLTEHKDFVQKSDGQGKDAIWYELEVPELAQLGMGDKPIFGDTIKVYMTPAQKVHLYLESKNMDNLRHMLGGRTFVNKNLYSKGKRQEALVQGTTVRLAPETVKKIVSDLTAEEMELAQVLEAYYNTFSTMEINRVSNVLLGYDKAMSKNYAPIYTNENFTKSKFGVFDVTAEGVGNLKERHVSKNPSYNISCFDAFERHVDQTARYVGMAIPVRNWSTLMNWRERNNSTSNVISHKWGASGNEYIADLLTTLQGGKGYSDDIISGFAGKLMGNYISAVFGANPGIVLKQLGSIPMASAYLGISNAPSISQVMSIDKDLISKYSQDLAWRTMGYTTPETKQLKENPNWTQTNKFFKFTFGGGAITAMDGWAASTLWPWAENKVRKEFPDLEVGTQEQIDAGLSPFYKKVAEEFEAAMSRSQSVSDEMHQGQLRKSKNPITKAFTMFRSDSAQTYNTLRQKFGEAMYYARNGESKQVVKAAKKAVGAAVLATMTNAIWAEAVSFLMALWKNKGKKYRDEEEELTAESVLGEMVSNMLYSMAGTSTGGEELAQVIGNLLTGEKIYDIEVPGMEQVNDLVDVITKSGKTLREVISGAVDVAKNDGDLGAYFSNHITDILGGVKELAEAGAMYFGGLSVSNLEAYLLGAIKWISPELGVAYDDMFSQPNKNDLSGLTGDALEVRLENIFNQKNIDVSDDTISALGRLYEKGYTDAVPGDIPSKVAINGEDRKLSPYQQQVFGEVWSNAVGDALEELVASEDFKNADKETQAKMLKALYDHGTTCAKAELFEDYVPETSTFLHGMTGEPLAQQIGKVFDYRGVDTSDDTASALAPLYENGLTSAVPSAAPDSVTVNGDDRKLSAEQQATYNQVWSDAIADALEELVASKEFQDADEETQAKMLKALYDHGTAMAKAELFEDYELESGTVQTQEIVSAGASLAQCVAWNKATSEMKAFEKSDLLSGMDMPEDAKRAIFQYKISESRGDVISACDEAGMEFDQFLEVYSKYGEINAMDLSATQKATEFAYWLDEQEYSEEQMAIIEDGLTYFNMTPASASQYEKFVDAGMDADDAYELVQDLNELEPIGEADDVTDLQKWRACVDFSSNENVQLAALAGKMQESQFMKVQIAYDFDITPDTYVTLRETLPRYDADGNGSLNQSEVKTAIDSMSGLTSEERAVLWQLSVSTKSAKNNPYSTEIGQQVLDAKG